ncbi:MAG: hypothetical protein KTR31_38345 [Myxococcales bacterium]|nr:hypothetical protein [Myxococcales bacterium]
MWGGLLVACAPAPEAASEAPPASADTPTAEPVPSKRPSVHATLVSAEGVDVALAFVDISPLYRGYFATQEWVATLGKDLGACFGDTVEVVISYDMETRIGRILVQTSWTDLGCRPAMGPEGVDLTPLQPLGRALARYRDAIAAARDVRIASFRSGIRLVQGGEICDLIIGGQFPPDGTTFSGCITLRGHEVCLGERHEPHATLPWPSGEQADMLRTCLGR